ncbi:MAG: prepilin peptidase [Alphaproteobacteria bacterium]|nr:prepilin peptidase [Alphaproteobacteria bacterium]
MRVDESIIELAHIWPWFIPTVIAILGGIVGSFANCIADRIPKKIPLRQPPSYCSACKKTLTIYDLIPVFSWIWLRGRCRHCGVFFGIDNMLAELSFALVGLLAYWVVMPKLFVSIQKIIVDLGSLGIDLFEYWITIPYFASFLAIPLLWSLMFLCLLFKSQVSNT